MAGGKCGEVWRGEVFYSSHESVSVFQWAVLLDCGLHVLLSFLPLLVGQDGYSGVESFPSSAWKTRAVGVFPFPTLIRLIQFQQVRFWLNSFSWGQILLRRRECSGTFQNGSFTLPVPEAKGNLSPIPVLTVENLVELLEAKFTKVWGASMTGSSGVSLSALSMVSLQQFIMYSLGFSTLALVPVVVFALVSCDFFIIHLSVSSISRAAFCPVTSFLWWI